MSPREYPSTPYLKDSVALVLFMMPEVTHEGVTYDVVILCVDRESGWIVAEPHRTKGLTGEKVAKCMYRNWTMFGLPSVVTTDHGSHWVSGWWNTMCALHGIREHFGIAYHHQSNGRAEAAGKQIDPLIPTLIST